MFRSERLLDEVRLSLGHIDRVALTVVAAAGICGAVVLFTFPKNPIWYTTFVPEHITLLHMADSTAQRAAYVVFLALIAVGSYVLPLLRRTLNKLLIYQRSWALFLGEVFHVTVTILTFQRPLLILFSTLLVALAALASSYCRTAWVIPLGTVLLISLAVIPGVLCTPVPDPENLSWIDWHYSVVLSQGDRLAAGRLLYVDNTPYYGILVPVTIALVQRSGTALTFGGLVRLVQAGQTLFLLAFVASAWVRIRGAQAGKRALAMLLLVLVVGPWTSTVGPALWYPNQSGLRFLTLPLAVLASEALVSTDFL